MIQEQSNYKKKESKNISNFKSKIKLKLLKRGIGGDVGNKGLMGDKGYKGNPGSVSLTGVKGWK